MKVAVAAQREADVRYVTEHFGHCESFIFYQVENGETKEVEEVENPGHQPGFLPEFLGEKGIDLVIAGGMGARAIELFNAKGIKVIIGAAGEVSKVISDYAGGCLETSGSTCSH
jgi:predicted Fe-Mo cluster-binding NifX family protein